MDKLNLVDLRVKAVARLREETAAAVERLLEQWVTTGHTGHILEIRRVRLPNDGPFVDRFRCFRDGVTLTLLHDSTMEDGIFTWTITPHVDSDRITAAQQNAPRTVDEAAAGLRR